MVQVISSKIVSKNPQRDGSCWVVEEFILDDGRLKRYPYLADPGFDVEKRLSDRAQQIPIEVAAEDERLANSDPVGDMLNGFLEATASIPDSDKRAAVAKQKAAELASALEAVKEDEP